jgi:hypothetical protein
MHPVAVQRAAVHTAMREVNRRLRGHDFLPAWDALTAIPLLRATEQVPLAEKIIHLHFFIGACDWYVAELDDDTWEVFGYADLGDPQNAEWGYFSLPELEAVVVASGFVVERDLDWAPQRFSAVERRR